MRKYYRLLLLAVAVVSVITLLFYRHEYNKLRYVLEVFNYFGKPDQRELFDNCTKSGTKPLKVSYNFDEPFTSWQRLSDDLFVYSSYSKNSGQVVTIGFGKLRNDLNLNCNVYLDNENGSVHGKFSYSIMKNTTDVMGNEEYCGYILKCDHSEQESLLLGVTYYQDSGESPILSLMHSSPEPLNSNNYAFCVAPLENNGMATLSEMTNFLNNHNSLGVDDFIVYDYGIPTSYNQQLVSSSKFSLTKIPWNFPFSTTRRTIITSIIEFDCLYRTYNKAMYAAVLSWEENIVLNYHSSLHNLFIDFKRNKMYGDRYMLRNSVFCVQNMDEKSKMNATIARKQEKNWKSLYILKPNDVLYNDLVKTMQVLPDLAEVKRYQVCSNSIQENLKSKISNLRKSFRFAGDT